MIIILVNYQLIYLMKRAVLLILILSFALAMNVIETNSLISRPDWKIDQPQALKNLKIANYTGSSITPSMITVYLKIINDAYLYYRDNVTANAQYIQNKLQGSYSGYFYVLIFAENSTADHCLYSLPGLTVAWTKVNTAKPLWSYVISTLDTPLTNSNIFGSYQKGSGISSSLEAVIQNIIRNYETGKTCSCFPCSTGSDLRNFDNQRWNVVCSAPKVSGGSGFIGQIRQSGGQYLQTLEMTTGRCRYLLWVV